MYSVKGGLIFDGTSEIRLRGVSHHGFNAPILRPEYLWEMGWKEQLAQIKSLGFNAVRCPFVPDTLYAPKGADSYLEPRLNADLSGKTPLQTLDMWMAEADRIGLYILLDFHSVTPKTQFPLWYCNDPTLIYNKKIYTKENWIRDLVFVAARYKHLPQFLGIDIFNEPHGDARWNAGDLNMQKPSNYWKIEAQMAASSVLAANPNILIFVQGCVAMDGKSKPEEANWGEDFQAHAYDPLKMPKDNLVLSCHTYGPDVYRKKLFDDPTFPANLPGHWDTLFGQFRTVHAVVPGEWGGLYGNGQVSESTKKPSGPEDIAWQNAFVDYMISRGIRSSFYWSYTPNSGDTGGVLDNNLQVREDKMVMLNRLWAAAPPVPVVPPTPGPSRPQIIVADGNIQIIGKGSVTITVG